MHLGLLSCLRGVARIQEDVLQGLCKSEGDSCLGSLGLRVQESPKTETATVIGMSCVLSTLLLCGRLGQTKVRKVALICRRPSDPIISKEAPGSSSGRL